MMRATARECDDEGNSEEAFPFYPRAESVSREKKT
jgi:hypothetical protein